MAGFTDRAVPLARTVQRIAQLQGATQEAALMAAATPTLIESGYDNLDGGTYEYTFTLEVPVETYVRLESDRRGLEESIKKRLLELIRVDRGVYISQVVISPYMDSETPYATEDRLAIESEPAPAFWTLGHFRLFLSHATELKAPTHALKAALAPYQVAAFVAHDDIEPTREWQAEIESALRTMDAMAAIISPEVLRSRWCDQEVGFALGRNRLVVPLRAGADPHGFLGKSQGLQVKGVKTPEIARELVAILIRNPLSSARMTDATIDRLRQSTSWSNSRLAMDLLELTPALNSGQIARIAAAVDENSEVGESNGVPARIERLVATVGDPDS